MGNLTAIIVTMIIMIEMGATATLVVDRLSVRTIRILVHTSMMGCPHMKTVTITATSLTTAMMIPTPSLHQNGGTKKGWGETILTMTANIMGTMITTTLDSTMTTAT